MIEPAKRRLAAVFLVSLALNGTAIWWGLPSRYGWAVDELNPTIILKGIDERFSGDWHQPAYPPLHYYVLAASYLPVLGLDLVEPHSVEGHTLFFYLGRLLSLAMGIGILWTLFLIAGETFDENAAVFACLAASFTAPFVYYTKTANLDVPVSFWFLTSVYFFLRLRRTGALRDMLSFTLAAVCAICTKDQAFAFYVLPLLAYGVERYRGARPLFDRDVFVALATGIGSFLLIHNVVFNFQGFVHHFEEILWARGHYSAFEASASSQLDMLFQSFRHVRFSFGWPSTIAALAGIAVAARRPTRSPAALWVLLFAISYYLFFIAPVRSTWLRYIVPVVLVLALFAGRFFSFLWRRSRFTRLVAAAALAYSFAYAASVDVLMLSDSRYFVESWLSENVAPDESLAFMGPEYYLPRPDLIGARRLRPTESVLERARPDFLVVNPDYFARFTPDSREGRLYSRLRAGRAGYGIVLQYRSRPRAVLLDFDGILGNMSKIDPLIEVYERAD